MFFTEHFKQVTIRGFTFKKYSMLSFRMCYNVCYNFSKMPATSIKKKSNRNVLNIIGGGNLKVLFMKKCLEFCVIKF